MLILRFVKQQLGKRCYHFVTLVSLKPLKSPDYIGFLQYLFGS